MFNRMNVVLKFYSFYFMILSLKCYCLTNGGFVFLLQVSFLIQSFVNKHRQICRYRKYIDGIVQIFTKEYI